MDEELLELRVRRASTAKMAERVREWEGAYHASVALEQAAFKKLMKSIPDGDAKSALLVPWKHWRNNSDGTWDATVGSHVRDVAAEGIELARLLGRPLVINFNHTRLTILAGEDPEAVYMRYANSIRK